MKFGIFSLDVVISIDLLKLERIFLLEYLKTSGYERTRTAIMCSRDDEVVELSQMLNRDFTIQTTPYTKDAQSSDRVNALRWHQPTDKPLSVLITSDEILGDLYETKNVQVLINYTMPPESWFRLSFRFQLFFDYYHNYVVLGPEPDDYKPECHIFTDDTDNPDVFLRFVEFMQRTTAKIPADCIKFANQYAAEKEKRRQSIRLCPYFLQFGECGVHKCQDRHTLNETDIPADYMPKEGQTLKLKMTHVHNPTHYSARILEYHEPGERIWHKYDQAFMEVGLKLQMFYNCNENLQAADSEKISKGDLCTWIEADKYHRCQVLDVLTPSHG